MRTVMSVITGVMVWSFALVTGIELATAWGVIAFAFNYIPIIGPLVATVFPTLFALAQFESWQLAIVVFLVLNAVQFVTGSYIEPRMAGARLSISPFVVLLAVFLDLPVGHRRHVYRRSDHDCGPRHLPRVRIDPLIAKLLAGHGEDVA